MDDSEVGIDPALVESVVGKDLRERWEWIKENRKAETGEFTTESIFSTFD